MANLITSNEWITKYEKKVIEVPKTIETETSNKRSRKQPSHNIIHAKSASTIGSIMVDKAKTWLNNENINASSIGAKINDDVEELKKDQKRRRLMDDIFKTKQQIDESKERLELAQFTQKTIAEAKMKVLQKYNEIKKLNGYNPSAGALEQNETVKKIETQAMRDLHILDTAYMYTHYAVESNNVECNHCYCKQSHLVNEINEFTANNKK